MVIFRVKTEIGEKWCFSAINLKLAENDRFWSAKNIKGKNCIGKSNWKSYERWVIWVVVPQFEIDLVLFFRISDFRSVSKLCHFSAAKVSRILRLLMYNFWYSNSRFQNCLFSPPWKSNYEKFKVSIWCVERAHWLAVWILGSRAPSSQKTYSENLKMIAKSLTCSIGTVIIPENPHHSFESP